MYRCQATGKQVPSGQPAYKLVTHVRLKTYYRVDHKTGLSEAIAQGTEIAREILVSKEYYEQSIAKEFKPEVIREANSTNRFSIYK